MKQFMGSLQASVYIIFCITSLSNDLKRQKSTKDNVIKHKILQFTDMRQSTLPKN